jgi:cell division inhibitor SepF
MSYYNAEPEEDTEDSHADRRPRGWFSQFMEAFRRDDDDNVEEEEDHADSVSIPRPSRSSGGSSKPIKRGANTLHLETIKRSRITVRRTVQSFEDVRRAVDGLNDGVQQIINLEQTPADMSERLIDFMNGATYCIEGSVEKIGEQVYLFTPPNVTVDVETKPFAPSRTAFFDKE